MAKYDQCKGDCTVDCGHCKGQPVKICVGCFNKVAKPSDHAVGCPTGQNGSPNYN